VMRGSAGVAAEHPDERGRPVTLEHVTVNVSPYRAKVARAPGACKGATVGVYVALRPWRTTRSTGCVSSRSRTWRRRRRPWCRS
jgi:hypothetical protein